MRYEPLREAVLAQVRADAARLVAGADREAAATLADARRRASALVEQARREGSAAGAIAGAHDEAEARRKARALILAAERALYDELRDRVAAGGQALRVSPAYPRLLDRLAESAHAQLGEGALIERDLPEGGVRASVNGRSVDYSLPALVERALTGLGGGTERLWQ